MSRTLGRTLAVLISLALVAAACGSGDDDDDGGSSSDTTTADSAEPIDYEAIGLWDDGPCDESQAPAEDRAHDGLRVARALAEGPGDALEASAEAFNARGGANGSCIEVTTCDDGGNVDQAVGVRADASTRPASSRR